MRAWIAGAAMMMLPVAGQTNPPMEPGTLVALPEVVRSGGMSLTQSLGERRSVRSYSPGPITLQEVSQLLWAAQGITEPRQGFRTAPSAGATFPLEVDLLVTGISELPDGIYRYRPRGHRLELRLAGDHRRSLQDAALGQDSIGSVVIGAFRDERVTATLNLERSEEPLYILPLGRAR
jgi:nitroreductase